MPSTPARPPATGRGSRKARALLLTVLLTAGLGSGCSDENPTEIYLAVATDLRVPRELDELQLDIRRGPQQVIADERYPLDPQKSGYIELPATLGLVSKSNEPGPPLHIRAVGRLHGKPVVERVAELPFAPRRVVLLRLVLRRRCAGVTCPRKGDTCDERGRCAPARIDPASLPDYQPNTPLTVEASTPQPDAGVDAKPAPDSAPPDSAPPDSAPPDSAPPDSAPPDSAPRDLGPPDMPRCVTSPGTLAFNSTNWTFHARNNAGYPKPTGVADAVTLIPDNTYGAGGVVLYTAKVLPPFAVDFDYSIWDDDGSPGINYNSGDGLVFMFGKDRTAYTPSTAPSGSAMGFVGDGNGYGIKLQIYGQSRVALFNGFDKEIFGFDVSAPNWVYTSRTYQPVRVEVRSGRVKVLYHGSAVIDRPLPTALKYHAIGFGAGTGQADGEFRVRNVRVTCLP